METVLESVKILEKNTLADELMAAETADVVKKYSRWQRTPGCSLQLPLFCVLVMQLYNYSNVSDGIKQ